MAKLKSESIEICEGGLCLLCEDLVGQIRPPQSDDVWLVSGGGSGVTAASIIGVANASRNAGATFLLLEEVGWLRKPHNG